MALSKRVLSLEHHKRPTSRLTENSSIALHHAWADENLRILRIGTYVSGACNKGLYRTVIPR